MSDLIERDALMADIEGEPLAIDSVKSVLHMIARRAPAVDVAPVVHGRWVGNGIEDSLLSKCTVCGYPCGAYSFNFCPNCAAKMLHGADAQKG